jgi:Xaa-Pro dipeptidase
MEDKEVGCIVASSRENVLYSSGVSASIPLRPAPVVIPLDGDPVILVHPSGSGAGEDVTVRKVSWIKDIRLYDGGEWAPFRVWDAIANVLKEKGLQDSTVGVEVLEIVGGCYDHLRGLLPTVTFTSCEQVFDELRAVKSPEEIKILKDANMATAKALSDAFEEVSNGDTERQVARFIMEGVLDSGANRLAFLSLAAGPNVVEPHHSPGDYKLRKGDMVHVDVGGVWKGYVSDISRMAVVGKPDESQRRAFEVVIKQIWDTAESMQNGVSVLDVHNAAKKSYESHGLKYPRYFIGHSIGLRGHEHPFLAPFHGDWELEPNMFFQLEPSHVASEKIRVHYEDSFLIKENGPAENVSEYADSWELLTIK